MSEESIKNTLGKMDDILVEAMNEYTLPGLAVGIVRNGELVYHKGLGYSDIEERKPVEAETVFRIGSISKTFTALGVMQLYEQGGLQLDDPVNNYLKTYKILHRDPNAPPVTIRHLLTHTSGIGELRDVFDLVKPVEGLGVKPDAPEVPLGEYYNGILHPEIYPGEKITYANHAFATLGQLVEDVSGEPFGEYMVHHVFEPLGMHTTDYFLTDRVKAGLADAYQFKKGSFEPVKYLRIEVPGAGSIFSTLNDMAKYVAALMNKGANQYGRVVGPETFDLMVTPQLHTDPRLGVDFGLYFVLTHYGDHRIIWHNGGWPGFISAMYVAPDDQLGVLVFTNTTSPAPDLIAIDVLHRMLDVPMPISKLPPKGVLQSPHQWPQLCGFYGPKPGFLTNLRLWMGFGGEIEVFVKDNHLAIRSLTGAMRKGLLLHQISPQDPLYYQGIAGKGVIQVLFKENDEGQVDRLLTSTEELFKRPLQESLRFKFTAIAGTIGGLILFVLGRKIFQRQRS
jgi:CubicO group peptidase (beta-lactamase class C family)